MAEPAPRAPVALGVSAASRSSLLLWLPQGPLALHGRGAPARPLAAGPQRAGTDRGHQVSALPLHRRRQAPARPVRPRGCPASPAPRRAPAAARRAPDAARRAPAGARRWPLPLTRKGAVADRGGRRRRPARVWRRRLPDRHQAAFRRRGTGAGRGRGQRRRGRAREPQGPDAAGTHPPPRPGRRRRGRRSARRRGGDRRCRGARRGGGASATPRSRNAPATASPAASALRGPRRRRLRDRPGVRACPWTGRAPTAADVRAPTPVRTRPQRTTHARQQRRDARPPGPDRPPRSALVQDLGTDAHPGSALVTSAARSPTPGCTRSRPEPRWPRWWTPPEGPPPAYGACSPAATPAAGPPPTRSASWPFPRHLAAAGASFGAGVVLAALGPHLPGGRDRGPGALVGRSERPPVRPLPPRPVRDRRGRRGARLRGRRRSGAASANAVSLDLRAGRLRAPRRGGAVIASALRVFPEDFEDHRLNGPCERCSAGPRAAAATAGCARGRRGRSHHVRVNPITCEAHGICAGAAAGADHARRVGLSDRRRSHPPRPGARPRPPRRPRLPDARAAPPTRAQQEPRLAHITWAAARPAHGP